MVLLAVSSRIRVVRPGREGNEVVILTWSELETTRLRREGTKGDGEVSMQRRIITFGDGSRGCRVGNVATVVLLLRDLSKRNLKKVN